MPKSSRAIQILGIPVFLPGSALVGLALVAYFAIPAATSALGQAPSLVVWLVALLHGLAVYVGVVVHELGHVLVGRRFGYASEGLVLNFWGGHATFPGEFRRPIHQFAVALAGPFSTLITGAIGYGLLQVTSGVFASVMSWLAWSSLLIAGLNLLPGAPLDGGAALSSLIWAITGSPAKGRFASGVGGLFVAFLWMSSPWWIAQLFARQLDAVDVILSGLVGAYLAVNAMAFIASARVRASATEPTTYRESASTTPDTEIAPVSRFARRAVEVRIGTDVEAALAAAAEAQAGAIVVANESGPVGIVRNSAIAAVPASARADTLVESTARRITDSDAIPWQTPIDRLSPWLDQLHADEWLVVDTQGRVYGVVMRRDLISEEGAS